MPVICANRLKGDFVFSRHLPLATSHCLCRSGRNSGHFTKVFQFRWREAYPQVPREVVMSSKKRKGSLKGFRSVPPAPVSLAKALSPVVWVGWQIRPGEKYFGFIRRADGTVERTRLKRDDLNAAAEFVDEQRARNAAPSRRPRLPA